MSAKGSDALHTNQTKLTLTFLDATRTTELCTSDTNARRPSTKYKSIAIDRIGYRTNQTPFAQPNTPPCETSLCALSTPSPPRFQCVSVQGKRRTYLLPRPRPGKEGGILGLPKASVPSFSRQSGQYHLALRAGICVMPTHSKWNHSLSHCWGFVSLHVLERVNDGCVEEMMVARRNSRCCRN